MTATVQIRVIDSVFDCNTCANTVERVLEKTAGVESIRIEDDSNQVEVGFDDSQITAEEIIQLIDKWGYTVTDGT